MKKIRESFISKDFFPVVVSVGKKNHVLADVFLKWKNVKIIVDKKKEENIKFSLRKKAIIC